MKRIGLAALAAFALAGMAHAQDAVIQAGYR